MHFSSTSSACSPSPVPAVPILRPCSLRKVSATFFSARLTVGSVREHFLLQMGHSRLAFFLFQNCCRQARQKLWLHLSTTGSLKISQQIGQDSSSSSIEPDREELARGRVAKAALGLWKKESFPGWEEARGRSDMVGSCWQGAPFIAVIVCCRKCTVPLWKMCSSLKAAWVHSRIWTQFMSNQGYRSTGTWRTGLLLF